MADPFERNIELVNNSIEGYRTEYLQLSDTWDKLDSKAQGNIGVCGLFLAGMLAFIRALNESSDGVEKLSLTLICSLLFGSTFFAAKVLRVQDVPSGPVGESLNKLVQDLLRVESPVPSERILNFGKDQTTIWNTVNVEFRNANSAKALNLTRAQWLLQGAVAVAAFIVIYKIWLA
jgi:hypothetical protein